jgi:hypothetical protein
LESFNERLDDFNYFMVISVNESYKNGCDFIKNFGEYYLNECLDENFICCQNYGGLHLYLRFDFMNEIYFFYA